MLCTKRYKVIVIQSQIIILFDRNDMVSFELRRLYDSIGKAALAHIQIALLDLSRLLSPGVCMSELIGGR